jgi:hypothetical protein
MTEEAASEAALRVPPGRVTLGKDHELRDIGSSAVYVP